MFDPREGSTAYIPRTVVGCSGTRLLCKEVENINKEIQFSSYSTVEVDDEDAVQILSFLEDIKIRTEGRLQEIKDGIKLLEDQGIKSES